MFVVEKRTVSLRRPLLGLAVIFMAGSANGRLVLQPVCSAGLAAGGLLVALLAAWQRRRRFQPAHFLAGLACCICLYGTAALRAGLAQRAHKKATTGLTEIVGEKNRLSVRGSALTDPDGHLMVRGGARLYFIMETREVSPDGGESWIPWKTRLAVNLFGSPSLLSDNPPFVLPQTGEGWLVSGLLRESYRRKGSRQRSSHANLYRLNVSLSPRTLERYFPADASYWRRCLYTCRREAARRICRGIENKADAVMILKAMLLGYQSSLSRSLRHVFANSGTIHIFAISGLHVGILGIILTAVMPLSGLPRTRWIWILAPVLIAYTLMVGARPSAQRACLMAVLSFAAPGLRRRPDTLSALGAAAIVILAIAPLQVLDPGFLFSFACLFGILTLKNPIQNLLEKPVFPLKKDQIDVPEMDLSKFGRLYNDILHCFSKLRKKIASSISVSLAVWMLTLPLTLMYFGRVTPSAIIGNLFAIPLAFTIVLSGVLSLVSSFISAGISVCLNHVSALLVDLLVTLTHITADLPGSSFQAKPWSPGMAVCWYVGCLLLGIFLHSIPAKADQKAG